MQRSREELNLTQSTSGTLLVSRETRVCSCVSCFGDEYKSLTALQEEREKKTEFEKDARLLRMDGLLVPPSVHWAE